MQFAVAFAPTEHVVERDELRAVVAFKVAVVEPVEALPLVCVVAVMARDGGDVSVQLVVVKVCCNKTADAAQRNSRRSR